MTNDEARELLRRDLEVSGLTKRAYAERMLVSRWTLNRWLAGETRIPQFVSEWRLKKPGDGGSRR